jgi:hypothetical protein
MTLGFENNVCQKNDEKNDEKNDLIESKEKKALIE